MDFHRSKENFKYWPIKKILDYSEGFLYTHANYISNTCNQSKGYIYTHVSEDINKTKEKKKDGAV